MIIPKKIKRKKLLFVPVLNLVVIKNIVNVIKKV